MTDRYSAIAEVEQAGSIVDLSTKSKQLRLLARNPQWLSNFDKEPLERIVALLLKSEDRVVELDLVATLANILFMNANLRNDPSPSDLLRTIPKLYAMLDLVSERRFNSELQYQNFLPIFRLYFFLTQNKVILPALQQSVLKISGKLLNFVTLSSQDSSSLNNIIMEILKILYSDVHQLEDTTGIDSYYVLSCNKFNLLYAKLTDTSDDYDQILEHFGNVLVAISTDISENYMLNKALFVRNQVKLLNKILSKPISTSLVRYLLTLELLLQIDNGESGLEKYIKDNLNFDAFRSIHNDPHLPVVLADLEHKLHSSMALTQILENSTEYQHKAHSQPSGETRPRFEDLSEEEQDKEIQKMQDIFGKIEKNGVFNIQMN